MLRFHYMPSDFHPLLLIVGERSDVSELHRFFEGLSSHVTQTDMHELSFVSAASFPVVVIPSDGQSIQGLSLQTESKGMWWEVSPHTASAFADELCEVLEAASNSGSCFLEIGYVGEIRAKVVFGEFDDSYLLNGE